MARRATSSSDHLDEPDAMPDRILRVGLVIAVVGTLVQGLSELVDYFAFDLDVWNLNADADNNAFAWASSVAQFAAAFCCSLLLIAGWWSFRRLLALTLILAFFSLDDIARFHEDLAFEFRQDVLGVQLAYGRVIWPILFFPLLAAAFILLWRFADQATARAAGFIRLSLVMLVLAVFAEMGSTALGSDSEDTLPYVLEVVVEEGLELAAWVLIAAAAAAVLTTTLIRRGRAAS
jgi:hypothetical protein